MPGPGAPAADMTSSFGLAPAGSRNSRGVLGPTEAGQVLPTPCVPADGPNSAPGPWVGPGLLGPEAPASLETLPSRRFPPRDPRAPPPRPPGPGRCPATLSAGGWIGPGALSPGTPAASVAAPNTTLAPRGAPGFWETCSCFHAHPPGTQPSTHHPPVHPLHRVPTSHSRLLTCSSCLHRPPPRPHHGFMDPLCPPAPHPSSARHTPPHRWTQHPSRASQGPQPT